jgi:hypothetical protein
VQQDGEVRRERPERCDVSTRPTRYCSAVRSSNRLGSTVDSDDGRCFGTSAGEGRTRTLRVHHANGLETAGMANGAYELTGPAEGQLEQYVGRRVETVGRMKSGPTAMSDKTPEVRATVPESTTGRPDVPSTAAASPSGRPARPAGGVDITGQFQEKNCVARTGASAQPRPERVLVESLDQGAIGAAPRGRR